MHPYDAGYRDELTFARALAVNAGAILLRHFRTGLAVQMKGWADPVTAADRESETLIADEINRRFPGDGIFGEEGGARPGTTGRTWIVDPLDGTADFAGGLPIFAVVITLIEDSDRDHAVLNVTYDPIRQETFHAVRGHGAFLNDKPIETSPVGDLDGALVHLHFSNKAGIWERTVELARRISHVAPHTRMLGSTALAQAYVAAGRLDANAQVESGAFDVVGGNLLITEAGGVVSDLAGAPWRLNGSLLAAAPHVHPRLVALGLDV